MNLIKRKIVDIEKKIRHIGHTPLLNNHEKRKLGIFNLMNFTLGITLGVLLPVLAYYAGVRAPAYDLVLVTAGPLLISLIAWLFIIRRRQEAGRMSFFVLHTILMMSLYVLRLDIGADLYFICYGVLSVFFLQNTYNIIFSFSLSMTCYFIAYSFSKEGQFNSEKDFPDLFLFNHLLPVFFIFYGIFLVRNENVRHNERIRSQRQELRERAVLMERQARQLRQLNSLKNKLFSAIAHDLRGPMHALHRLFSNMESYDLPGEEIKILIPDVVKDLAHTAVHMDNLLQWAKSQMQAETVNPQMLEISGLIKDMLTFLHLQADAKRLRIECKINRPVYVYADREMINLVLRNLLSNAIKFTPEGGIITLATVEEPSYIEIFVKDTGAGINAETLKKLKENLHYSSPGTNNETGTGLGLMLCREFLTRNGGQLNMKSDPGGGSVFSFTLPRSA